MAGWLAYTELLARRSQEASAAADEQSQRPQEVWREALAVVSHYNLLPSRLTATESTEPAAVSAITRRIADVAEQRGALHQAFSMLCALEEVDAPDVVEWGRVLAQRARVARKADAPEVARRLYGRVRRLGKMKQNAELLARAHVGLGVLAQYRGNLPEARRRYEAAVREADRSGIHELSSRAHHGMMVVAARAGAYAEALVHGWRAFTDAEGDADLEAESLLNLAQLALDLGEASAALNGFTAALTRTSLDRLTLPALGGAARAAAALGDERVGLIVDRQLRERIRTTVLSYQRASASLEIAMAHAVAENMVAARREATEARRIARRHAFHELDHESTQLLDRIDHATHGLPIGDATRPSASADRPRLAEDAEDVLRQLTTLASAAPLLTPFTPDAGEKGDAGRTVR